MRRSHYFEPEVVKDEIANRAAYEAKYGKTLVTLEVDGYHIYKVGKVVNIILAIVHSFSAVEDFFLFCV